MIILRAGNKVYDYIFHTPGASLNEIKYKLQQLNVDRVLEKQTNKESSIYSNRNADESAIISNIRNKKRNRQGNYSLLKFTCIYCRYEDKKYWNLRLK